MRSKLFIMVILAFQTSVAQTTDEFRYKKYLNNSSSTLGIFIESINKTSGSVSVNGGDTQPMSKAPSWNWGDGIKTNGYFPQTHTYKDVNKNYLLKVTAFYSNDKSDSVETSIRFAPYTINKISLPDFCKVSIPREPINLSAHFPTDPHNLTVFNDSSFTSISREDMEYVLTAAATIQTDMVNNNLYKNNGRFEQVVLRDSIFGGGYSLWSTDPVVFAMNENYFKGEIGFSSFFHEMGHNVTLNTPANYFYGGKIDGNANAIYSETMANIFAYASGLLLVNDAEYFGFDPALVFDIKQSLISSCFKCLVGSYNSYLNSGKTFHSWNDYSTDIDEASPAFNTIVYKFFEQAELNNKDYLQACKRMMKLLQHFNEDWKNRYSQYTNSPDAETFRATLLIAAISYGLDTDLRNDFRNLNFPVDDIIYNEIISYEPTGVASDIEPPKNFLLEQNYPNPFNLSTSIKYTLPSTEMIKLDVYDVLGRKVATLVNEVQQPGSYNIQLINLQLPSGIYFYWLSTGNYSAVRKMILLK